MARAVKEEAEAHGAMHREAIKKAFQQAKADGFPTDLEEKESYFMSQVAQGEALCSEGECQRAMGRWPLTNDPQTTSRLPWPSTRRSRCTRSPRT